MKLYLFDQWGECSSFYRDSQDDIQRSYEEELPESLYDDSPDGVLCVWEGEIIDPRSLSQEECDEKGIPYEDSRDCESWWMGEMRPATDAEILAVFSSVTPTPEARDGD